MMMKVKRTGEKRSIARILDLPSLTMMTIAAVAILYYLLTYHEVLAERRLLMLCYLTIVKKVVEGAYIGVAFTFELSLHVCTEKRKVLFVFLYCKHLFRVCIKSHHHR